MDDAQFWTFLLSVLAAFGAGAAFYVRDRAALRAELEAKLNTMSVRLDASQERADKSDADLHSRINRVQEHQHKAEMHAAQHYATSDRVEKMEARILDAIAKISERLDDLMKRGREERRQ